MRKILLTILFILSISTVNTVACNNCEGFISPTPILSESVEDDTSVSLMSNYPTLEQTVYDAVSNYTSTIYVSKYKMNLNTFAEWYKEFIFLNGELPINPATFGYEIKSGYVEHFTPVYLYPDSNVHKKKINEFKSLLDSIYNYAAKGSNDFEKALLAHDKIASDYYYDQNQSANGSYNIFSHTAYGFMENGYGVCQGYTFLYGAVLDKLGIKNAVCFSDNLNHIWSCINIDNKWYHTDLTFNDSDSNNVYVWHNYFLLSGNTLYNRNHASNDWVILGTDGDYDFSSTLYESEYFFNGNFIFPVYKENDVLKFTFNNYKFNIENIKQGPFHLSAPKKVADNNYDVCMILISSYNKPLKFITSSYNNGQYISSKISSHSKLSTGEYTFIYGTLSVQHKTDLTKLMLIDSQTLTPLAPCAIMEE